MYRLLLFILPLVLVGCNAVQQMYGEGPVLITERLSTSITEYDRDLRFRNVSIAIDKDARNAAMKYCPALGDCTNSLDGSVVELCNKGGKYDCAILMQDDRIVWRGPVFMRHKATSQVLPYSGRWRLAHGWTGVGTGETEAVAHFGRIRTGPIGDAGECLMKLRPGGTGTGTVDIDCSAGVVARGTYQLEDSKTLTITARDNEGRDLKLEMHLSAGRAERG